MPERPGPEGQPVDVVRIMKEIRESIQTKREQRVLPNLLVERLTHDSPSVGKQKSFQLCETYSPTLEFHCAGSRQNKRGHFQFFCEYTQTGLR